MVSGSSPSPHHAVVMNDLPWSHHRATQVAGTGFGGDTVTRIIQEGARRADAAIHRHEGHVTGDVRLAQGAARGLAAVYHVGVALGLRAATRILGWRWAGDTQVSGWVACPRSPWARPNWGWSGPRLGFPSGWGEEA